MPNIENNDQPQTAVTAGLQKAIAAMMNAPHDGTLIGDAAYRDPREVVRLAIYEQIILKEGEAAAYIDPIDRAEALLRFIEARMIGRLKDKVIWINPDLPNTLD